MAEHEIIEAKTRTIDGPEKRHWFALLGSAGATALSGFMLFKNGIDKNGIDLDVQWRQMLRWGGGTIAGAFTGTRIYRQRFSEADRIGNNGKSGRRFATTMAVIGAASFGVSFVHGGSDTIDLSSPDTTTPVTSGNGETSTSGTATETTEAGVCEVTLPLDSNDVTGLKKIQAGLTEIGFNAGPIDGEQGAMTNQALVDFKTANSFSAQIKLNDEMCLLIPSLVDGNPNTPNIG